MNNLNSILIEGDLVCDLQTRNEKTSAFPICVMVIATNRYYKNADGLQKETGYFKIETHGNLSEQVLKSEKAKKGRVIRVVGRLVQRMKKDENGNFCSSVLVIAEHVQFSPMFKKTKKKAEAELEEKTAKTAELDSFADVNNSKELFDEILSA